MHFLHVDTRAISEIFFIYKCAFRPGIFIIRFYLMCMGYQITFDSVAMSDAKYGLCFFLGTNETSYNLHLNKEKVPLKLCVCKSRLQHRPRLVALSWWLKD